MDISTETINRILELARPELVVVGGRQYSTSQLRPIEDPEPETLKVHTLSGLIDYYQKNIDGLTPAPVIHISSHEEVALISSVFGTFKQRSVFLIAENLNKTSFRFGQNYNVEEFIVSIQSQFVQDETTAAILKLVGNVKDEKVMNWTDDGVTQAVTAKAGIALVQQVPVPNPIVLRPFRTFLEIEQPTSPFVFRVKAGNGAAPLCAIHEADGGLWKNAAIFAIREYLKKALPEAVIIA